MLPFTLDELNAAVEQGRVTKRPHPSLPLFIYNYSPDVQYSNRWDEVTLNCRGLILTNSGAIVARPWKKFFNLGQVNLPIQFDDPVEVMDKADGSLGILYPGRHGYAIATRGSFCSDQAVHATDVWKERYYYLKPDPGYTFLFEIIYPENRIVLDYKGIDDLVLLGAVEIATGYYVSPTVAQYMFTDGGARSYWGGPTIDVFPYKSISEALAHMGRAGAEGYVIRSHNFMVKLKEPDYVELHRLVTNITPKTVWEQLRAGKSVKQICSVLPDEFHNYAESIAKPMVDKYNKRAAEIFDGYFEIVGKMTKQGVTKVNRKAYATEIKKYADKQYYFLLLDDRGIADLLWKELRPREEKVELDG